MKERRMKHIQSIIENKKIKTFGVEIPLTDEQLKEFEKMVKPKYKNPYERVNENETYYTIFKNFFGEFEVNKYTENCAREDDFRFENGVYYNDEEFAEQIAMELNLQQKLRKFTYDNGWSEELWENGCTPKYFVYLNVDSDVFEIYTDFCVKRQGIYFKTEEITQRAIDEIILPFMKENPTFKWWGG